MAPVHSVNSYSFSSSSSEARSNAHCNRELVNHWDRNLPVSFRGRFFEDSLFESARAHYDEKVKGLLDDWDAADTLFDEWCNTASSSSTRKQSFKNLLSRNQEKQIASVTSEDGEFKILLDVREYTIEEIRVGVVGEREVEVEGHQALKENEASNIHKTPTKFRYLISLPEDAEMDTITAAMSADGILSISVPTKTFFNKTCHQIPVEVKEHENILLSSASGSTVSFSKNNSDFLSHSSSSTKCVNTLRKENEESERSGQRASMDRNDHKSTCQVGEMQKSSKTVLCVENLNGDHKEKCDDSYRIKNTGSNCEESEIHSLLCNMSIKGAAVDTSEKEDKESERHLLNENPCHSSSFMNLPITRRESFSNEDIKKSCSISNDEYLFNPEEISNEESGTMIYHTHGTSVKENAIETLRLDEDYLKSKEQQQQPYELNIPMKVENRNPAVHYVQINESVELQNEQSLIDGTNVISVVNQSSLDSSTHENEVSLVESYGSSTQESDSSSQRMEAHVLQEQTMTGRNSLDFEDIYQNLDVFLSDDKSGNNFTMSKTTCVNEHEEITEKELTLPSYNETQASFTSSSNVIDTRIPEENVERQNREKTPTNSKDSLQEYQSALTDSWSTHVGVDSNESSRNLSRNLLIAKRGSFFIDPHFEGMQEYYLTAVREVLSKYGSFPFACDELSFYRNLRMQDQKENMAAITFENENKLHFILDLYNIMKEEEINVDIVNEQEIMVREEVNEIHSEEEISSLFSKCLNIYGEVDTNSAKVALSSEGVLVISIPKKVLHHDTSTSSETYKDIPNSNSQTSDIYLTEVTDQNSAELSQKLKCENENKMNCVSGNNGLSSDHTATEKSTVLQSIRHSVVIEDSVNGKGFAYKDQPTVELKSYHQKQQHKESAPHDETENITPYEDNKDCEETMSQVSDRVSFTQDEVLPQVLQVSQKAFASDNRDHIALEDLELCSSLHTNNCICVSVEERGLFHEDTFFDGMQNYLLKAIREILSNYYDMSATDEDEMTLYRNFINNSGLKDEHCIASVSLKDEFSFKVVLDAHKFMKIRNVTLSILNDKIMEVSMEVIVEDGLRKCSSKSFAVPDGLDIYNAVAGISSDGILAISIPKHSILVDNNQPSKIVFFEANQSNNTLDTSTSALATHQEIFREASVPESLQNEVSILNRSSAVDSHISSASKRDEVEECDSAETQSEKREEETRLENGYQFKSDGNQEKWDQLINIIETSAFTAEIKNDKDGNSSDEEGDSDTSTVVGVPCSFEINSITDDESSTFSPNVNYAVTFAESPQVESNGLLTSEISTENERSSKYEESNRATYAARQLLPQSSRLSIHTVDESETECDDSWLLSADGISRNSSVEDSSDCNYDSLSAFGLSSFQENRCNNASMNQAYLSQNSNASVTQSESMFSSSQSTKDLSSNDISVGNLHHTKRNMQMTSEQMISGETFGRSKTVIQASASSTTASVSKRQCTKSRFLTMTKRGLFFEDSFFSEVQESFQTAMRETLLKSSDEDKCKHSSDIASYKCWRKQNPKIENQAVFVSEDHDTHKVVLDIESLLEDSVTLSVVEGKELLIEGQSTILEDTLEESRVHSRRFVLPDQVDVDAITATLSLDGILLIISPKTSTDLIL